MRIVYLLGIMFAAAGTALAQTPGVKCQAAKNEASGKLADCLAKAEKKFVLTADGTAYAEAIAQCSGKFDGKWAKLEQKAVDGGGACTTADDADGISGFVAGCTIAIADALAGNPLIDDPAVCAAAVASCGGSLTSCSNSLATCSGSLTTCNDGTATEDDVVMGKTLAGVAGTPITGTAQVRGNVSGTAGSLSMAIADGFYSGSKTCTASDADLIASNISSGVNLFAVAGTFVPAQPLKTGQTTCFNTTGPISCAGSGQDGALQKGLSPSYTDNGNGTITDNRTGLTWEKLCDQDPPGVTCDTEHDVDSTYSWTNASFKLQHLNSASFGGHNDWRLPNIKELRSLSHRASVNPAMNPIFNSGCSAPCSVTTCSCYRGPLASSFWTSTTNALEPQYAWIVNFASGDSNPEPKGGTKLVRAVRGGS